MKKFLLEIAVVFACIPVSVAMAADLAARPHTKAPVLAPVYDWSGFYAGVNVGLGLGRNLTGHATPDILGVSTRSYLGPLGAIGGGQLGYNWQRGSWVFGLETDLQAAGMRDDQTCGYTCGPPAGTSVRLDQKLDWFGTVRGRVGLATGPVLSYVTGGYTYGGVKTAALVELAEPGSASISETRTGWTVGSGVEASLGGNWTGKIEYLYLDLGTQTGAYTSGDIPNAFSSDIHEHIFRAGVNYRIGGNGIYAAAPTADWTGLYVGANAGTGTARNQSSATLAVPPFPPDSAETFHLSPDGYLGGVQIGYNWQAANWVFGFEADIQGSTQKDDKSCQLNCRLDGLLFLAIDQRLPWFGTVRGRLGYSLGSTLFYATGGLAYGEVKTRFTEVIGPVQFNADFKHTRAGWTAGAGIETPFELFGWFGKNWTSKTEYLYVDLGSVSDSYLTAGFPHTINSTVQEHIFRTGLNYHFNSPVVAKY